MRTSNAHLFGGSCGKGPATSLVFAGDSKTGRRVRKTYSVKKEFFRCALKEAVDVGKLQAG